MKKLILAMCLAVLSIGAFASSSKVVSKTKIATLTKTLGLEKSKKENVTKLFNLKDCIAVSFSCGVTYDICNFSGTLEQLINSVLNSNNNVCGTHFKMIEVEVDPD